MLEEKFSQKFSKKSTNETLELALYACASRGRHAVDVMRSIAVLVPHEVWIRRSQQLFCGWNVFAQRLN